MVNSEQFTQRLNKILDYYDLSAASFADKIDVGRSSISHLLSGRNKPSLDFVMKIISAFPEVELYWLLNGKGTFPKSDAPVSPPSPQFSETKKTSAVTNDLFSESLNKNLTQQIPFQQKNKQIQRVVIFYNDGTFEAYENSQ